MARFREETVYLKTDYDGMPKSANGMTKKNIVDLDDVIDEVGDFGRYQFYILILLCIPNLFGTANEFSYVFTAGVPKYRCFIPECEEPHNSSYDKPWLSWAIPSESSQNQVLEIQSDSCSRYSPTNVSELNATTCSADRFTTTIETCSELIFDDTERTIVNDWNITCLENHWKISLFGTSHFVGVLFGTILCGALADKYGRKVILLVFTFLMGLSGTLQVLSPEYITFVVFKFIHGLATSTVFLLVFILGMESAGRKKRELPGVILSCFSSVGGAAVALIAYYFQDWLQIQLIVSVPAFLIVGYHWVIPESMRWLLANARREEAKTIMLKAAKMNQVTLSDEAIEFLEKGSLKEMGNTETDSMSGVLTQYVTSKKLVARFAIVYFICVVIVFVFYGLSINSTSLGGNKYLNFSMVSLAEIPGYILSSVIMRTLGRKISLVASLIVAGVTCIVTIFVNSESGNWAVISFFLLGKLSISAAYTIVFVYIAELLPTIIRSAGVGSSATVSRIGSLLAPFAPMLALYYNELPMIVFGSVAILAGLLAARLPETSGRRLPETVQEAKSI